MQMPEVWGPLELKNRKCQKVVLSDPNSSQMMLSRFLLGVAGR